MEEARDTAQDRVTIQEAARRLGVKEDAIRKRIQRGSLRHEKTEEGRVFVWVDPTEDTTKDTTEDAYQDTAQDAVLKAKDETIAALREQLEQANERDRENRRIIAALTQRIPAIEPPGSPEARESPSEATPQPGRVEHQPSVESAQEPLESSEMHMPEAGRWWSTTPRPTEGLRASVVAEGVRRIVMGELDDTARRLLRDMGYQAEGSPTLDVLPREAAENLGLDPSSPEYRAALDHLLALGDIEREAPPDPNLPEPELYRLTRQGLARVRELQELENYVGDSLAREQHHRGGGLSEEKG